MPYNPGISYRGEMLGQSIGAAGQSIAQSYGQGLRLAEVKKQRDKLEAADRKRAEVYIDTMYTDDPEAGKMLKKQMGGWEAADISGWLQGQDDSMRMQAQQTQLTLGNLKLQEFEDRLAQDPVMRQAMSDMTMYLTEQNQSPMDALNSATMANPDLSQENRLKLNALVQSRQTLDFNARSLLLKQAASETDALNAQTNAANAALNQKQFEEGQKRRAKGAQVHPIEGIEGSAVVEFPSGSGTRSQLVQTGQPDPVAAAEARAVDENITSKADTAYAEADQIARGGGEELKEIKGGDERTGLGASRYNRLAKQYASLDSLNKQHRARTGQDHPKHKEFMDRVAPLVQHMREQRRSQDDLQKILQSIGFRRTYNQMKQEGRDKEAKEFAEKFGVDPER